jgi:hypothetical protein
MGHMDSVSVILIIPGGQVVTSGSYASGINTLYLPLLSEGSVMIASTARERVDKI